MANKKQKQPIELLIEYKPVKFNQSDVPKLPIDSKEIIKFLEEWEKQIRPILDFRASEKRKKRVMDSIFYRASTYTYFT